MVESIIIQDVETAEKLVMDKMTTEDYVLEYVDWNVASVNQFTSKYIGQVGVTINRVSYKERPIEIVGYIVADSEKQMTRRKQFLNRFVNPQKEYFAIYNGTYKIMFMPKNSIRYSNTDEQNNNEVICKFKIEGICPNPLFSILEASKVELKETISQFRFPFYIPRPQKIMFGFKSVGENNKQVIRNKGEVETGFRFKFTHNLKVNDEIRMPSLYNFTTGQHFQITRPLYPTQYIVVDTRIGQKKVYGGFDGFKNIENYFKYKSPDSQWMVLKVGDNLLGIDALSNKESLEVTIEIENKFLEVQQCY